MLFLVNTLGQTAFSHFDSECNHYCPPFRWAEWDQQDPTNQGGQQKAIGDLELVYCSRSDWYTQEQGNNKNKKSDKVRESHTLKSCQEDISGKTFQNCGWEKMAGALLPTTTLSALPIALQIRHWSLPHLASPGIRGPANPLLPQHTTGTPWGNVRVNEEVKPGLEKTD